MKQSPSVRKLIEELKTVEGDEGAFLMRNCGLIIKTTLKKFGSNFCAATILSDAVMAYYVMKEKHDENLGTKETSSYFWQLNHQMDITYSTGIPVDSKYLASSSKDSGAPGGDDFALDEESHRRYRCGHSESGLTQEEELCFGFGDATEFDNPDPEENGNGNGRSKCPDVEQMAYVPKFVICLESFQEVDCSLELSMTIKALSDNSTRKNRRQLEKLFAGRQPFKAVKERFEEELISAVLNSGRLPFVAICKNGSLNKVLIAARSEQEAAKYVIKYGVLMEVKQFGLSPLHVAS